MKTYPTFGYFSRGPTLSGSLWLWFKRWLGAVCFVILVRVGVRLALLLFFLLLHWLSH